MKKSSNEKKAASYPWFRDQTKQGIISVIFLILSVFFVLAKFKLAGPAGNFTYSALSALFGTGYLLFSIVCLFIGLSFLKQKSVAAVNIFGGLLLLVSSLGILDTVFNEPTREIITGGWIGHFISIPLLKLFDKIITIVFLTATSVISILIMFSTHLSLEWSLFGKKLFGNESGQEENGGPSGSTISEDNIITPTVELAKEGKETKETERDELSKKETAVKGKIEKFFDDNLKTLPHKNFEAPPLSLLERDAGKPVVGDIKANANIIKRTLLNFGIDVEMDEISIGPSITRYSLKPAEGIKLARILSLQNDLALALAAHPIRIEAPIPGKSLVGIEIPNKTKSTVSLGALLGSNKFQESTLPLLIPIGRGVSGIPYFGDLAKAPHLLIAGATGSGKSVTIHTIITALLYRNPPEHLRFIMIDPKRVELTLYNGVPHLLTPVITESKKSILVLKWAAKEMEKRYNILERCKVRDIASYHKESAERESMPYIVIIIDELADIMSVYPRELEAAIVRLAQMSRAVGIHLVLSTQRPSVEIITGLIKANIPSRMALQVPSQIDSRTILDMSGAEKLLGAGDMLYTSGDTAKPIRVQSGYISETEVKKVVKFLVDAHKEKPPDEIDISDTQEPSGEFNSSSDTDDLKDDDDFMYDEAKELVTTTGKASASYLQRRLKLGYARAARIMDMLEERGVIGPGDGAKPREVYQSNNTIYDGGGDETE